MVEAAYFNTSDWFGIVNKQTGLALDNFYQKKNEDGVKALDNNINNQAHQWKFQKIGDNYNIINRQSQGSLEHWGELPGIGNIRCGMQLPDNLNQQWQILESSIPENEGFFYIMNCKSGMVMGHHDGGIQAVEIQNEESLWQFIKTGKQIMQRSEIYNENYGVINKVTGMALDHYYGKPGEDGVQANNNDINNVVHQWRFIRQGENFNLFNHGTNCILYNLEGKPGNGNIRCFTPQQSNKEYQWKIIQVSLGNFRIQNIKSGLYLSHSQVGIEGTQTLEDNSIWNFIVVVSTKLPEQSLNKTQWYGIVNKISGITLDHYYEMQGAEGIKALSGNYNIHSSQWKLEKVGENVSIVNRKSNGTLDHWYSKSGIGNIRCGPNSSYNPSHQWKLVEASAAQNQGFIHIENLKSGQRLAHFEGGIQALDSKGEVTLWELVAISE